MISEYHQVVDGTRPEPTPERWDELRDWVPRLNTVVKRGVELLLQTINGREEGWESVDSWVERSLTADTLRFPEHYKDKSRERFRTMLVSHTMTLIMDVAKMNTMYWGVADPEVEGWCSYCKSARPIAEFDASRYTCDSCFYRRKG